MAASYARKKPFQINAPKNLLESRRGAVPHASPFPLPAHQYTEGEVQSDELAGL
jgi:hypothetical protein